MNIKPEIGMGVTECVGSDCYPYTVVEIITPKKIMIAADKYIIASGSAHDGSAEWRYERDTKSTPTEVKLSKDGRWYTKGGKLSGRRFYVGDRRYYYDPHF